MKYLLLILVLLLSFNSAFSSTIMGKITQNEDGTTLAGATIRVEKKSFGAYAKNDGKYKFKLPIGKHTILVSMVGYKTIKQEVTIKGGDNEYNFAMEIQHLQTDEVVVSANKRIQSVQEVPISISVLDSRQIELRNITELDDALRYVPGVEMNGDQVSIRGSSGFAFGIGSRVSLRLDGFPLLAGDNGDMKFDAVSMPNVERIEVIKGSGSALYGTSAIGGVVNIITKTPKEKPDYLVRAFTGYYTDPRYEQWKYTDQARLKNGFDLGYSQAYDNIGVIVSGGLYQDDSYRKYDASVNWNLFGKFIYGQNEPTSFSLLTSFASSQKDDLVFWNSLDSALIPPTGTDETIEITSKKAAVFGEVRHILSDNHFFIARGGLFRTSFETSHAIDHDDYRQSASNAWNTEIQINSNYTKDFMLTYGMTGNFNDITSKTYGDRQQQIYAIYTQGELTYIKDLNITLGARVDKESTDSLSTEAQFSPKLGLLYSIDKDFNLRGSIGHGFRAPLVSERFASLNFSGFKVIENLNLIPEKSWSYEIGARYEFDIETTKIGLDFAIFQNDMRDMIEPGFIKKDDKLVIQFQNITEARIRGIEFGVKTFLFSMVGVESSITAMDPQDLTTNEMLKYRSKYLWKSRLFIPMDMLDFNIDYRFKSEIENVDDRLGVEIKDYDARVPVHVVDLAVKFKMKKVNEIPLNITLNIKNLFDYYYVEMVGNMAPTRYISLQLESDF
jgi:outer membrane receptor for ferrienterochelin and colicins